MSGRILGLVGLLGLMVTFGLGCEATVPRKDYDTAATERNEYMAKSKGLQNDLDAANRDKVDLQKQLADMQTGLPAGATAHTVGGQPAFALDAALLYASGKAQITPAGQAALQKVAEKLKKQYGGSEIRVEGHTDTDPITKTKDKYDTNWDLGAKRANEVVVFLTEKCGIDPKRVYSASYSMYRPMGTNKAANRRVEIVILPPMTPGSSYSTSSMTGATEEK